MAAGLGFKTFTTGEVLTAADTNGYLMQGVLVFASAAARDAAITSPQEGQFAYLKDTNVTTYYTGSAWTNLDTTGMTNPMTTTGDMVYSSSGSTPARLGIGSTGQVVTVAGGVPTWATPASGSTFVGARCLITTSITGVATSTVQIISWTAEDYDTDSIHSLVTNTSRLTVPSGKGGYWGISTTQLWNSSTAGYRQTVIRKNGTAVALSSNPAGAGDYGLGLWNGVLALAAADYIEIGAFQTSGSNRTIYGNDADTGVTAVNFYYLGA